VLRIMKALPDRRRNNNNNNCHRAALCLIGSRTSCERSESDKVDVAGREEVHDQFESSGGNGFGRK
jgi:hypothetical protein